jgi:cutinase
MPYTPGACPDVDVVFARGTGEQAGLASVGHPFVDALGAGLPGKTVMYYAVNFEAHWAQASTVAGANDMENHVTTVAAQCPNTKFVLGGYSQGAAVVDVTLGLGPVLGPAYAAAGLIWPPALGYTTGLGTLIAAQPGLPDSLAGRIAAVVTWGNPIHWANQSIATASSVYGQMSDDFCNGQDPVCANGTAFPDPLATHRQYASNGDAQKGAQFAADKVKAAG